MKIRLFASIGVACSVLAGAYGQVPIDARKSAVTLFDPVLGVSGPPEDQDSAPIPGGVRVSVRRPGATPFTVQVQTDSSHVAVHFGDVVFVTFESRSTSTGGGLWQLIGQRNRSPWDGYFNAQGTVGADWKRFNVNWTANKEISPRSMGITFHIASQAQELEFRNFVAVDLGPYKGPLPFTPVTYRGREANAPWRKEAEVRIDRYRKADLTLRVVDSSGRPVKGAAVHVRQTRHAYEFGSFVEAPLLSKNEDGDRYREWFLKAYNKATTPMYWADWGWESPEERARYMQYPKWLEDHGIATKAHVLIYPGWGFMPTWLRKYENDPSELWKTLEAHIREKLAAVKPFGFVSWDVINETRDQRDLVKSFGGEDIYVRLFKLAKQLDPGPRLFINENTIVTQGGRTESEQAEYERMIRYLLAHGAPLEGIGMQGHFGENLTAPEDVWRIVDRFAKFGLPIQITEFDLPIQDANAQADYTRDFLTAWFAHPATTGFTMWGFWQGSMWQPAGALVDRHWNIRQNGQAWLDLVKKRWWTDKVVITDSSGLAKIRVFKGQYEIDAGKAKKAISILAGTELKLRG